MRRWTLTLLAGSVCAAALVAQQPMFKTGIEYVSVDVIVTDKHDKPVTDLTKADFAITENKKPQVVRDFQYVSIPIEHRQIDAAQTQPPPPDVATNMPPSPKSRLFAIVIDDLHIIEQDLIPLKSMLAELVRSFSPDDEVAVVFVGRSDLGVNVTSNLGRILYPIDHLKNALGLGEDAFGAEGVNRVPEETKAPPKPIPPVKTRETLNHARSSAVTLDSVVNSLAGSGHTRRAIFFVTGGFAVDYKPGDFDYMTLRDDLDKAYASAARADVPIYTIDPRGLITAQNASRWDRADNVVFPAVRNQQQYIAEIAVNTGGRAVMNTADTNKAVDELVAENGSYYVLGYSPDPLVRDGKFHDIDVKVSRPGLIVRPRKGYVAPSSTPASTDAKPILDKAIGAGVNMSGIQLRAFVTPIAIAANGMNAAVTVELRYPTEGHRATTLTDNFEMTVVALDADGKVKATSARSLHFSTAPPDSGNAVTFLIDDAIVLPQQALILRIGVASQALGTVGTVQLPIDVPKAMDGKLHLGEVVIGYSDFLREAALQRELIKDLVPFQPTTSRTFAVKDTLRIFDRLFWGSKDTAADVTLTITGGTAQAPQIVHLTGTPTAGNASHREATLDTRVPLKDFTTGSYVMRVEAKLANSQAVHRDIPFEVK